MTERSKKRVLDVGQCQADHGAIRRLIETKFQATVEPVADIPGAMQRLSEEHFDLVLVNRVLDATADEGIELIRKMQDSEFLCDVPVMMVSNFDSAQEEATRAGAASGFGKAHLDDPATRERLAAYLS